MTITKAKSQIIDTTLAPIAVDETDIVRRSVTALYRQGVLTGVINEAIRRNLCVLRVGRYLTIFNSCRLVWLHNPQPIEVSGAKRLAQSMVDKDGAAVLP